MKKTNENNKSKIKFSFNVFRINIKFMKYIYFLAFIFYSYFHNRILYVYVIFLTITCYI